jgi:hypothetical protein
MQQNKVVAGQAIPYIGGRGAGIVLYDVTTAGIDPVSPEKMLICNIRIISDLLWVGKLSSGTVPSNTSQKFWRINSRPKNLY